MISGHPPRVWEGAAGTAFLAGTAAARPEATMKKKKMLEKMLEKM